VSVDAFTSWWAKVTALDQAGPAKADAEPKKPDARRGARPGEGKGSDDDDDGAKGGKAGRDDEDKATRAKLRQAAKGDDDDDDDDGGGGAGKGKKAAKGKAAVPEADSEEEAADGAEQYEYSKDLDTREVRPDSCEA
jgi:hypothetical protein